jgi:hypothetical protein
MNHWLVATGIGILLGLLLYACVRIRMYLGPILKKHYGNRVRQMYWVFTMAVMVLIANTALIGLQKYLSDPLVPGNHLIIEIWFALLALAVALTLIFRKLRRNS